MEVSDDLKKDVIARLKRLTAPRSKDSVPDAFPKGLPESSAEIEGADSGDPKKDMPQDPPWGASHMLQGSGEGPER